MSSKRFENVFYCLHFFRFCELGLKRLNFIKSKMSHVYFNCTKLLNNKWSVNGISVSEKGPWYVFLESDKPMQNHPFLNSKLSNKTYQRVKVGRYRNLKVKILFQFS